MKANDTLQIKPTQVSVQAYHNAVFPKTNPGLREVALAVVWDGTNHSFAGDTHAGGFYLFTEGLKKTLLNHDAVCFARFRSFPLPGGDACLRQPRRTALGLLWEIFGDEFSELDRNPAIKSFHKLELRLIRQILATKRAAPLTCSPARLFDAVASIFGLCQEVQFEGQALQELERAALPQVEYEHSFRLLEENDLLIVDWEPLILQMLGEHECGLPMGKIIAAFHNTMAETIVAVTKKSGVRKVVLSGCCFRNKYLADRMVRRLSEEGFYPRLDRQTVLWNDTRCPHHQLHISS